MKDFSDMGLEVKFVSLGETEPVDGGLKVEGYASYFGELDRGGDGRIGVARFGCRA